MQLGRYNVSTLRPNPISSIRFNNTSTHFVISTEGGYEVWRTFPLTLLRRRALPGTLALAVMIPYTPLLVLQGGGNNPVYPPNKAVIYHDDLCLPIAELEFSERIRGIVIRRNTVCIALPRRVVAFTFGIASGILPQGEHSSSSVKGKRKEGQTGFWLQKFGEWETAENEQGLMAISTSPLSTLLALPGRQAGHVQLVSLPPCPPLLPAFTPLRPTSYRSPIILAHTHVLSSLTCSTDGSHIITTSERGTLLRVWDTARGHLVQELRRGVDRAEMWGASFQPSIPSTRPVASKEFPSVKPRGTVESVVGWSDKGTIHIWSPSTQSSQSTHTPSPSITNLLSKTLPLPKYFSSTASSAQYHLPRKNPHAFTNVVNAAAGKAGVHSRNEDQEESEMSERFVVTWIPVPINHSSTSTTKLDAPPGGTAAQGGKYTTQMGSRDERRSFGSDATSRTATPTFRTRTSTVGGINVGRSETPTMSRRQSSYSTISNPRGRSGSSGTKSSSKRTTINVPASTADGEDGMEWQLVAITFSGDWYRLRLPDHTVDEEVKIGEGDVKRRGKKCELVEYRRLGSGGGGW